jgi:glucoamylase
LNLFGLGAVVAAPDNSTPGGSYWYHWERDGALSMRTFMKLNDFDYDKVSEKMDSYI